MEPNRILPDLQASLLCEQVRQEANGNLFLIGILGIIPVPKFPIKAAQLCVFNRWTAGVGTFVESTRFLGPDQTTVLRAKEMQFQLRDASHHVSNVTVFTQMEFQQPGVYYVEVQVDQVMKIRYPVPIIHRPMQQNQPNPSKPQQPKPDSTSPDPPADESSSDPSA